MLQIKPTFISISRRCNTLLPARLGVQSAARGLTQKNDQHNHHHNGKIAQQKYADLQRELRKFMREDQVVCYSPLHKTSPGLLAQLISNIYK